MTTVSLVLWPYAGTSGLTLFLYKETTPATVANTGGDTLTPGAEGTFTATVAESLSGMYNVVVKQGSSVVAAGGKAYFDGSSTVYVDATPPEIYPPAERDVADLRPIEFYWKSIGATFANSASTCTRRFSGETGAQAEALSGAITAVSGVTGLYKLAYNIADRAADAATIIPTEVTYRLVDDAGNIEDLTLRITKTSAFGSTVSGMPSPTIFSNGTTVRSDKTVYRGDTIVVSILYSELDESGDPVPVSTATDSWRMTISSGTLPKITLAQLTSAANEISLDHGGEVGRVIATRPFSASLLPPGTHDWDMERTTSGGVRTTVVIGKMRVLEDAS